ncbi:MAG TPA: hypothetical protein VN887_03790, partial [Candidatus Angelobacter sp.]|nr:hypothetical protein [Candidatus Angelobacter sp.]
MDEDKSIVANFQYSPATVTNAPGATNFVTNTNSWGPGSFRQAVRNLVASDGGSVLFSNVIGTIALPLGLPHLTADARIEGPGPENVTLNFPYGTEAFAFNVGTTGIISGLTIQSAHSTNRPGGAINNSGNLLLNRVHLLSCGSLTNGGAVFNSGDLQLHDCVFAQNSAPSGGAIYNQGNFLADSSEFTGNQSFARSQDYASGGGAFYNASGEVEFTRCSFSNNTAAGVSGAFENPSDVNAGSGVGGAVYVLAGNAGFT